MMPRIVVVTGASGGIGRATRGRVRRPRRHRRAAGPRRDGLAAAAAEVERGRRYGAVPMPVDVADPDAVIAAADRSRPRSAPIDVWVNVAFTSVFAPFDQIKPEEYPAGHRGQLPRLRLRARWRRCKHMKARDRGTIVQVGSALAYRGIPLQSAYCGAKHAIQGFHEALRCELLHEKTNVHVTMVQMPAVNTPQFSWVLSRLPRHAQPVPPIYQPEVAARGGPVRRRPPAPPRVLGRARAPSPPWPPTRSPPDCWTATWAGPASTPSRPRTARTRTPRSTCGSRPTATDGHDFGAHGVFDAKATADPQLWASHITAARRVASPGPPPARTLLRRSAVGVAAAGYAVGKPSRGC